MKNREPVPWVLIVLAGMALVAIGLWWTSWRTMEQPVPPAMPEPSSPRSAPDVGFSEPRIEVEKAALEPAVSEPNSDTPETPKSENWPNLIVTVNGAKGAPVANVSVVLEGCETRGSRTGTLGVCTFYLIRPGKWRVNVEGVTKSLDVSASSSVCQVTIVIDVDVLFQGRLMLQSDIQPETCRVALFERLTTSGEIMEEYRDALQIEMKGWIEKGFVETNVDSRGYFEMKVPRGGDRLLRVTTPRFRYEEIVSVDPRFRDLWIGRLDGPALIIGKIEGVTHSGVRVDVFTTDQINPLRHWQVDADAEGRFAVDGLPLAPVMLMLTDHFQIQRMVLGPGENRVTIAMPEHGIAGHVIRGSIDDRIFTVGVLPVEMQWSVEFAMLSRFGAIPWLKAKTNDRGEYYFPHLADGVYRLRILEPRMQLNMERLVTVPGADLVTDPVELRMSPAGVLDYHVIRGSRATDPVLLILVTDGEEAMTWHLAGENDEKGKILLGLKRHTLVALAKGCGVACGSWKARDGAVERMEFKLKPCQPWKIRVLDERGEPVAGASVRLSTPPKDAKPEYLDRDLALALNNAGWLPVSTDGNGVADLGFLPAGMNWTLMIAAANGAVHFQEVKIDGGRQDAPFEIRCASSGK